MVRVKPFAAVRPPKNLVTEVAAPPYDVLNSEEAKEMAGEKSLLHITKPEIDFDPILPDHDPKVYDEAVKNFKEWQAKGCDILYQGEYAFCVRGWGYLISQAGLNLSIDVARKIQDEFISYILSRLNGKVTEE